MDDLWCGRPGGSAAAAAGGLRLVFRHRALCLWPLLCLGGRRDAEGLGDGDGLDVYRSICM